MSAAVLIVDDNAQNLKLASLLLTSDGFEVRTARHAEEALEVLAAWHPQLILMDIQLPGMDGLELTRQIKADPARQGIIVIALTAYAMKGDAERARAAGCDGHITKPIDVGTLPAYLRSLLP